MSIERRKMPKFSWSQNYFNTQELGMNGAIEEAKKIAKKTKNSIILDRVKNNANPDIIHFKTTAHECGMIHKGKN